MEKNNFSFCSPKKIIYDNGQFIGAKATDFFRSWKIKGITLAPYHPCHDPKIMSHDGT